MYILEFRFTNANQRQACIVSFNNTAMTFEVSEVQIRADGMLETGQTAVAKIFMSEASVINRMWRTP